MKKTSGKFYGKSYQVVDIWHALLTSIQCWLTLGFSILCATGILLWLLAGDFLPAHWLVYLVSLSFAVAIPFGIKVWDAQSAGIYIDASGATLSFSADDLENSLHEIVTFQRFFDHARRISIAIADIERLDNDNLKIGKSVLKRRCFALNISGDFGSYQLMFSHKQKRDECRALLVQVIKRVDSHVSQDHNIAFPY